MEQNSNLYQSENQSNTIYDMSIEYLNPKYNLWFNEIALELEIQLKDEKEWNILNINSLLIELNQSGRNISMNKLEILVKSHLIVSYNTIREYFERLPKYDGEKHIQKLAEYINTIDQEAFVYHFEKWFTRAVLCALKKGYVNKQALVLTNTIQNSGKTSFLRFLIPKKLEKYYTENISIDKDGIVAMCKNFIANIDELFVFSKTDVNVLKSFLSKSNANARLPYARKPEYLERIRSFVGSSNRTDFLRDETGSVRWLVFDVNSINFEYYKAIDIDKVWAQAYHNAFKRENFNPELTATDIKENEKRNEKFTQIP